jgi:hypothetical protein
LHGAVEQALRKERRPIERQLAAVVHFGEQFTDDGLHRETVAAKAGVGIVSPRRCGGASITAMPSGNTSIRPAHDWLGQIDDAVGALAHAAPPFHR